MSTQIQNQSLILWSAVWFFPFLPRKFPSQHNVFGAFVEISVKNFSASINCILWGPMQSHKELIRDFLVLFKFDQDLAVTVSSALALSTPSKYISGGKHQDKVQENWGFYQLFPLQGNMISDEVTEEDTETEPPFFLPLSSISIPSPFSLQTNFSCNLFTSASFCSSLSFRADSSSWKDRQPLRDSFHRQLRCFHNSLLGSTVGRSSAGLSDWGPWYLTLPEGAPTKVTLNTPTDLWAHNRAKSRGLWSEIVGLV